VTPAADTIHVTTRLGRDGRASGATAVARIDRAPAEVWAAVTDVERFARNIRMISSARRRGDDVTLDLKYKVGILFSVGFSFTARAVETEARILDLKWVSGEPRDMHLRFELAPEDDGRATLVSADATFDPMSLGWLAKYFLAHHPEIQFGIFPGVACVLVDALRKTVGSR
jgi:carbon monoxide dehydrogenase subunit G